MTPKPERLSDAVTLYEGDAMEILPTLVPGTVDAVVVDPPYMIGASSIGNARAKSGTWADMENSAWWFAEWFKMSNRTLKSTGAMFVFGNWRSLPTLLCAASRANLNPASCVVWDKDWIGTAHTTQFRPTWELFLMMARENFGIANRSEGDVWKVKWMAAHSGTWHPAEKPVELIARIIKNAAKPGSLILDPFAGSGTTAIAAMQEGRNCILIERDPAYCEIIRRRVREADGAAPGTLFREVARRESLFADEPEPEVAR